MSSKTLDEARSQEAAQRVKSKAKKPFDNAYRATLAIADSQYVQGFLVLHGNRCKIVEHAWLELEDCLIDPSFPFLNQPIDRLHYFAAHRLTRKQLKATVEESKEDYPEDDPLPVHGDPPYEYYGDVMLGGQNYQDAYEAAQQKCLELKTSKR